MNAIALSSGNNKKYWDYTSFAITQLSIFNIPVYVITFNDELKIQDEYVKKWKELNKNVTLLDSSNELKKIGFIPNDKIISNDPLTSFTWLRIAIPLLRQLRDFDKILYVDTDITIHGDLLSIFDFNFNGNLFSCVPDYVVMYGHLKNQLCELKDICKKLNIDYKNDNLYFNCGITLFNNKKIQQEINKYIDVISMGLKKYHELQWKYADQGMLNSFFKITPLPPKYNIEVWCQQLSQNDIIRHYIGGAKQLLDKIIEHNV